MSANPPPPKGFRGFLKDTTHRVKKALGPRGSPTGSRTPSRPSLATAPPQITIHQEQDPDPSAQPQKAAASSQRVPSIRQPTPTPSLSATTGVQLASTGSKISQAARQVGAHAWSGLKVALQLLETSSDVFPPLKSAVAGFLGVVDIFEVRYINLYVPA